MAYELNQSTNNSVLFDDVKITYPKGFIEVGSDGLAAAIARNNIQTQVNNNAGSLSSLTTDFSRLEASVNNPSTGLNSKASQASLTKVETDAKNARTSLSNTLSADYNKKLAGKPDIDSSGRILENNNIALSADHPPFANATKQVSISDGKQTAAVETLLRAQRTDIGNLQGQYVVKVQGTDSNGDPVFGGFGIGTESNGTVSAQFDVDTFSIGRVNGTAVKPFIVIDGIVYMNQAVIDKLLFNRLQTTNGEFVVNSNGRLKGSAIEASQIFLPYGNISGSKPAQDADKTQVAINQNLHTSGGLVLQNKGTIATENTAYNGGTGFYLTNDSDTAKFFIGNSQGNKMLWDGNQLIVVTNQSEGLKEIVNYDGQFSDDFRLGSKVYENAISRSFNFFDGTQPNDWKTAISLDVGVRDAGNTVSFDYSANFIFQQISNDSLQAGPGGPPVTFRIYNQTTGREVWKSSPIGASAQGPLTLPGVGQSDTDTIKGVNTYLLQGRWEKGTYSVGKVEVVRHSEQIEGVPQGQFTGFKVSSDDGVKWATYIDTSWQVRVSKLSSDFAPLYGPQIGLTSQSEFLIAYEKAPSSWFDSNNNFKGPISNSDYLLTNANHSLIMDVTSIWVRATEYSGK